MTLTVVRQESWTVGSAAKAAASAIGIRVRVCDPELLSQLNPNTVVLFPPTMPATDGKPPVSFATIGLRAYAYELRRLWKFCNPVLIPCTDVGTQGASWFGCQASSIADLLAKMMDADDTVIVGISFSQLRAIQQGEEYLNLVVAVHNLRPETVSNEMLDNARALLEQPALRDVDPDLWSELLRRFTNHSTQRVL